MPDNDAKTTQFAERERYEAPCVLEDLPLESFSLACGKATGQCDLDSPPAST